MLSRTSVSIPSICIAFVLTLLPACQTVSHGEPSTPSAPSTRAEAEHDVAVAREKLTLAQMQLEIARKRADDSRIRKERELEFARDELAQFDTLDAPNRAAKAKLELVRRQDDLFEQREELAQLEMMYEKEDLADKTREIVLQRGKRRVERAKEELAITERETQALQAHTLPRERSKLALEVDAKARDLEATLKETDATLLEKRIAVESAEAALRAAEAKAASTT